MRDPYADLDPAAHTYPDDGSHRVTHAQYETCPTCRDHYDALRTGRAERTEGRHLADAGKRVAYVPVLVADGWTLGLATEGEPGYAPTDYPVTPCGPTIYGSTAKAADILNARMGLTPDAAYRIVADTMARQNGEGLTGWEQRLPI